MKITVEINGNTVVLSPGQSVSQLLKHYKLDAKVTAVEINGCILEKEEYPSKIIMEADKIELIRFMGGG